MSDTDDVMAEVKARLYRAVGITDRYVGHVRNAKLKLVACRADRVGLLPSGAIAAIVDRAPSWTTYALAECERRMAHHAVRVHVERLVEAVKAELLLNSPEPRSPALIAESAAPPAGVAPVATAAPRSYAASVPAIARMQHSIAQTTAPQAPRPARPAHPLSAAAVQRGASRSSAVTAQPWRRPMH